MAKIALHRRIRTQRGEEPFVLPTGVPLLQRFLDDLLSLLPLRYLLEGIICDNAFESLKLERIASGHKVIVVDGLDEWLDLASLRDLLGAHSASHFRRISLNASDEGVGERVGL